LQQLLLLQNSLNISGNSSSSNLVVDNDNEENFYLDNQQQLQQSLSKNAQYDLIKKTLEKKKLQELQIQQQKLQAKLLHSKINQISQPQPPPPQQQYEPPVSKEYILSQLKAQKQKQKEIQQQSQHLQVKQQLTHQNRGPLESPNENALGGTSSTINLMHLLTKEASQNVSNSNTNSNTSPNDSFGSASNSSGLAKRNTHGKFRFLICLALIMRPGR
jgi:hypothetical protein